MNQEYMKQYDWSQDLPYRVIFHKIPFEHLIDHNEKDKAGFLADMHARAKAWALFATEAVMPLCTDTIGVIHGSYTIYFTSKEDVARVKIMLNDYIVFTQSLEEFRPTGGRISFEPKEY